MEGDGKRDIISRGPGTDYVYFDVSIYDPEIDLVFWDCERLDPN